ncbi:hypothetical protein [Winogradskyella haliclonae]|uniref:Lipoprotein n=1 Tax=Winogradskyella haliclonae TaxID=2048558 RepID=A0ABQ2BYK1_9FLAO|nr:hypothetical protein [Winogradskyella haliclonae]GGI56990.1 hypothetical protein GCM10011444_12990 [Winogradskyella haliclonae]
MLRFSLFLLLILSVSCSPKLSSSFVNDNYQNREYKRIAIIGVNDRLTSRLAFEKEAVSLYKENGINAVMGIDMFPQNMSQAEQEPENLIKIIKENNLDGIITISLVDVKDEHRYREGNIRSVPVGYYRVGRHIYRRYVTLRESGYYEQTKSYVIEAVLYDLKGELTENQDTWAWTGESALIDPSSLESAANTFCKKLVNHTIKEGIIKASFKNHEN